MIMSFFFLNPAKFIHVLFEMYKKNVLKSKILFGLSALFLFSTKPFPVTGAKSSMPSRRK